MEEDNFNLLKEDVYKSTANEILRNIECLITGFQHRYDERPRYIKVPIWVLITLKDYAKELLTNFNYKELELEENEDFTVYGLKVCPTITIQRLDEMEVF
jgi:hypothetical protein